MDITAIANSEHYRDSCDLDFQHFDSDASSRIIVSAGSGYAVNSYFKI